MADNYKISIDQGATYSLALTYKDSAGAAINLTGYTAAMQIRSSYESTTTVLSLTSSAGIVIIVGHCAAVNIIVCINICTCAGICILVNVS